MSSPICARKIFLSAPARTTARAPSPSITTPKRTRSGGGGGGAGGAGACTTGGGGGAGGRRLGETAGDRVSLTAGPGLRRNGIGGRSGRLFLLFGPRGGAKRRGRQEQEKDKCRWRSEISHGALAAKTRASLKWSATAGLRRHDPCCADRLHRQRIHKYVRRSAFKLIQHRAQRLQVHIKRGLQPDVSGASSRLAASPPDETRLAR